MKRSCLRRPQVSWRNISNCSFKAGYIASSLCTIILFTMAISLLPQFFFISILSTIIGMRNSAHAYSQCQEDQKTLLLELKNDLIFSSSNSIKLVQWNQTKDCCRWEGVECDGAGHVIGLQLDNETISGGIENSSSLFSLRHMKRLNLAYNNFNYIQIPRGIHNLTYLTHLNLSYAAFGGQIPLELSLLRRLVSLDISNYLYLRIQPLQLEHPNLGMLLQNLTRLRELYLDHVNISTQKSEWCHIISSCLPDLRNLSLRYCSLSGPLDQSILQLHSLSILQLDGNNFSTAVPDFFANFSSLTTLSLGDCSLQGSFPKSILRIPTLQNLDLSENKLLSSTITQFPQSRSFRSIVLSNTNFSGPLPDSISNFRTLSNVRFSNCNLTGPIPSTLSNIKELVSLDLSFNSLTGSLSSMHFEGLSNLAYLSLWNNSLSGSIPQSLFDLPSLQTLWLDHNKFNGTFQLKKIQRLRNLTRLDLSYNNLSVDAISTNSTLSAFPQLKYLGLASCNLHSFPDLRNQSNLYYLDLSNNWIAGEIPSWIWEIGNGQLDLNLSCNLLVDLQKPYHIPSFLGMLDLHSNQLRGELAPIIGDFTSSLYFLSLANNSLNGSIPTSLCNASNLELLDLSDNKLGGNINPCLLENTENLEVFNLGGNNISGDIPDSFSVNCDLQTLDLRNNNLGGNIPKSLGNCKSLEFIDFGNNSISDSFPCMLSSSLRVLVLRSNRFHGAVRCLSRWSNLQIIDIASNNFSGHLYPISFSSWKGMMLETDAQLKPRHSGFDFLHATVFYTGYYQDEVTLTIKGLPQKLIKIWPDFTTIDFSCNNFQGEIPHSIGDLSSLVHLNLSHNNFTRAIPKSFGNLTHLESLDLSVNQLTGKIPVELAVLTFLSVLNLSYNKLVGKIPVGPQLHTFPGAFDGNIGLCGSSLNISCNNKDVSPPKLGNEQSHGRMDIEWAYVCAAFGYVVGLGSIVWLLLCCQSFRAKYFGKVEEVLQKIIDRQPRKKKSTQE